MHQRNPLLAALLRSSLAGLVLALPFAGVAACGPTHTGLCERAADCGGGREPEIEACIEVMDAREEEAEIFSCEIEWDEYLDCLDDQGHCEMQVFGGCETRKKILDDCVGDRRAGHATVALEGAPEE
jgi:hypothetical protein